MTATRSIVCRWQPSGALVAEYLLPAGVADASSPGAWGPREEAHVFLEHREAMAWTEAHCYTDACGRRRMAFAIVLGGDEVRARATVPEPEWEEAGAPPRRSRRVRKTGGPEADPIEPSAVFSDLERRRLA